MGGGDFTAPATTVGEYLGLGKAESDIAPTYPRGVKYCDISKLFAGLYPCGEGAGYAGGIISAAIDGVRSAEEYVLNL